MMQFMKPRHAKQTSLQEIQLLVKYSESQKSYIATGVYYWKLHEFAKAQ